MNRIRMGLVGCGRIAQFHLEAIRANPVFQLVSVCDTNSDRAQAAASGFQAKTYDTLVTMLNFEKLDLVTVATPSGLHPIHGRLCADRGIACLSEKPLGTFYDEAQALVDHFKSKNVPLFVVMQNRYNTTVQKVRDWIEAGLLGRIYLLQSNVFWQRPQAYYDAESWRGKRKFDGGVFMNQASHYVDLMAWFGGEVVSVRSELETFERKVECEDTGSAVMRFKSGAIGVMSATVLAYGENMEGSLTIIAEKAIIKIGGKALNQLEVCRGEDPAFTRVDAYDVNYEPKTVYGNGLPEYYRRLAQFLKEPGHPQAITGVEGLKSLRILSMIYAEMDQGLK